MLKTFNFLTTRIKKLTMDKISIVTPSYNQGRFIEETIQSVVTQSYPNKEYYVFDGGSTDETPEILNRYNHQIDHWVSENDRGQSHAINKGLKMVTGDIVGWLNSDDYYAPEAFMQIAEAFKNNPEADLIYFNVRNFSQSGSTVHRHQANYPEEWFMTKVCLHQPGVFWRKSLMDRIGFLDESLHFVMDFDYWIRAYLNAKLIQIPQVVANFRLHNSSKTIDDPVELYLEKNLVIATMFHNLGADRHLDQLRNLDLVPEGKLNDYPVSKQIAAPTLDKILSRHLINNALLINKASDYSRSEKILGHLKAENLPGTFRAQLLGIRLGLRKLTGRY